MEEMTIDAAILIALVAGVFSAGGVVFLVQRLDRDLRFHMKEESEQRKENDKQWRDHLTRHAPSGGSE